MNPSRYTPDHADEQAALWAARLEGGVLSAEARTELDAWLAADPHHRIRLSSYCQFSADLEQQLPLLAGIRDELAEIPSAAKTVRTTPWRFWPHWAGIALATVVVFAAVHFRSPMGQKQNESLATRIAQRDSRTLADGTVVELNSQTTLAVEIRTEARHIRLAGGQAFFRVNKDPTRPFFVETPAGSVRVTGTAFDVRADPTVLEVTVVEGSVKVHPAAGKPADLTAGAQLTAQATGVEMRQLDPAGLDRALAWRRGQIVFDRTKLEEALKQFARYHGRTLTAAPEAADLRIGGRFGLDDLEGFLRGLEAIYHVRVTRDLDGAIHVSPPSSP